MRGRIAPTLIAIAAIGCNAIFSIHEGSPRLDVGAAGEPNAGGSSSAGASGAEVGGAGMNGAGGASGGSPSEGGTSGQGDSGEGGAGGVKPPNICGDGGGPAEGESCDDGNDRSGDGCSSTCRLEAVAVASSLHTCAVLGDGRLKCWGQNARGQLGLGHTDWHGDLPDQMGDNLPFVDLGSTSRVRSVALGAYHSCALLENGVVKCWGMNNTGQLGLGDDEDRGDQLDEMGLDLPAVNLGSQRFAKAIAAAGNHSCAILDDDSLKCWGLNGGQLGAGHTDILGDDEGEMGDALLPIDLGSERTASAVALGVGHTCALLDNGDVKCWGGNFDGRLGLGDLENRGDHEGEMGDDLDPVDLGAAAIAIGAGSFHTCAVLQDRNVKCWGLNNEGQLGLGDTETRGDTPSDMGTNLPPVELGAPGASTVTAGSYHTCVLFDVRNLKCWGNNSAGQLGLGNMIGRGTDSAGMGDNLQFVSLGLVEQLSSGITKNCAVLVSGQLKCWGAGGLGLGDMMFRGDGGNEMGENLPAVLLVGEN